MAEDVSAADQRRQRQRDSIRSYADRLAAERDMWIDRNRGFYEQDWTQMRLLAPPGRSVLELGCGTGRLLSELHPSRGVGVDISQRMIEEARRRHPDLTFIEGDIEDPGLFEGMNERFEYVVLSDLVGLLDDAQGVLEALAPVIGPTTRIVIAHYSRLWGPILRLAQLAGRKMPTPPQNWLAVEDVENFVELAGFEVVRRTWRQLLPVSLGGVGRFVNRYVGTLPILRRFALRSYVVARPGPAPMEPAPSVSIVIPCRNEEGNIAAAIDRLPRFAPEMEILFVEGHSSDGTFAEAERQRDAHPELDIKVMQQTGRGKGDAVRLGFGRARGDILMILDADLTTPPEDLPRFYELVASRRAELAMGSRLVYPMEDEAMRALNLAANWMFAVTFSWLLDQRITDTLCGTKVLTRENFLRIEERRKAEWGDFDPFGDFDIIFGSARHDLRIVEVPVHYAARTYGSTQISRFRNGAQLVKMVAFAYRKLKAV